MIPSVRNRCSPVRCVSRAVIALVILSLHATTAVGQYRVDVWTTEQGLPQNIVRAVHMGRDGYLHAFVWTEAGGMVEMPSLGRVEAVFAASPTGAFVGLSLEMKSNAQHAVLWAPSPASSKR